MSVLSYQLNVFSLKITDTCMLIFDFFISLPHVSSKILKFITLAQVQLLGHILVEAVFLMKDNQLLTHLVYIYCICTPALFHLAKHLSNFSELCLQESISPDKFITLPASLIQVSFDIVKLADLNCSFIHFVSAFFANSIVMYSKKGDLFEQDVVFFCKQVNSFHEGFVLIGIS